MSESVSGCEDSTVWLSELLERSAQVGLEKQRDDGSMPPGANGVYGDPETPVKTTGFWAVVFAKVFSQRNDSRYRDAAIDAINYICSDKARPNGYTFHHRNLSSKDSCNGLMGQAFTIESVAFTSKVLDIPNAVEICKDVFLHHPFNYDLGLWKRVEIDGDILTYDRTFNHQLWFAAAGSLLDDPEINEIIDMFLDRLSDNMATYETGLVKHPLFPEISFREAINMLTKPQERPLLRNEVLDLLPLQSRKKRLYNKAIGYQSVNLYALSLLGNKFPNHDIWKDENIVKASNYIKEISYKKAIQNNEKAYTNIATGFENAFFLETFCSDNTEIIQWWVEEQLKRSYDLQTSLMTNDAHDPETQAANIYRACRLDNYTIPTSVLK